MQGTGAGCPRIWRERTALGAGNRQGPVQVARHRMRPGGRGSGWAVRRQEDGGSAQAGGGAACRAEGGSHDRIAEARPRIRHVDGKAGGGARPAKVPCAVRTARHADAAARDGARVPRPRPRAGGGAECLREIRAAAAPRPLGMLRPSWERRACERSVPPPHATLSSAIIVPKLASMRTERPHKSRADTDCRPVRPQADNISGTKSMSDIQPQARIWGRPWRVHRPTVCRL